MPGELQFRLPGAGADLDQLGRDAQAGVEVGRTGDGRVAAGQRKREGLVVTDARAISMPAALMAVPRSFCGVKWSSRASAARTRARNGVVRRQRRERLLEQRDQRIVPTRVGHDMAAEAAHRRTRQALGVAERAGHGRSIRERLLRAEDITTAMDAPQPDRAASRSGPDPGR